MKLIILFFSILVAVGSAFADPFATDDVRIGNTAIAVPLGRIILVRKNSEYCAVKFTKSWSEEPGRIGIWFGKKRPDYYASYESYYQGDKTGNFSNENVQLTKERLSEPAIALKFSFGRNADVKCGPTKLRWSGPLFWLCFFSDHQEQGDYGVELAPTKWTDISQVNVFDERLKWYRYDTKRKEMNIPIDKLWDDKKP